MVSRATLQTTNLGMTLLKRVGYEDPVASGVDANSTLSALGSGFGVSQANGNLLITTGTTAYSSTFLRSRDCYAGASLRTRFANAVSQKIANQTFRYGVTDILGEGVAFTTTSTSAMTITLTEIPPRTVPVGAVISIAGASNLSATIVGQDVTVTAVNGLVLTVSGSGFTSGQTGTLTVYGLNMMLVELSGTSTTSATFMIRSNGNGNSLTVGINSVTSTNVVQLFRLADGYEMADATGTGTTGLGNLFTPRGGIVRNIFTPDCNMFAVYVVNHGSTAPASTTTWTSGFREIRISEPEECGGNSSAASGAQPYVKAESSFPVASVVTPLSVTTSASGTPYVTYASTACKALDVVNASGVTIEVQRDATGATIKLFSGQSRLFLGITNANQIGIRRLDVSTTTVAVEAEALVV